MSPTLRRNASAARFRSGARLTPSPAAIPRRRSSRHRCGSRRNIACRSSTTIQWSHSRPRRRGKATATLPSSTRRRDPRTVATTLPACSGCRAIRCACCRRMSEADSDPDCARSKNYRSPCWRRALKRSVRVTLTRQQMFTLGYRAANVHEMTLAANGDGSLASFRHEAVSMTSQFEDFQRDLVNWSSLLYKCANSELGQRLVKLDQNTPCDMRAPGGAEGAYAIECAMDELAYAANIDPLELRLINYSDKDQIEDRRYSSKELRECYRQGAEKFGWSRRNPQRRWRRDGNERVGGGMAPALWEAMQMPGSAKAALTANGSVEIASATADIGPGTYTWMTQLAAEMLGVPLENVTAKLGDSALPDAPVEG